MLWHIVLNVYDYDSSKAFYEQFLLVLWYELLREDDHTDCFIWSRKHPDEWFQFMLRQDKITPANVFVRNVGLDHLCFSVKENVVVDELYSKLSQSGTVISKNPMLYPEYSNDYYAFYFRDPDGIPLEIAYIG